MGAAEHFAYTGAVSCIVISVMSILSRYSPNADIRFVFDDQPKMRHLGSVAFDTIRNNLGHKVRLPIFHDSRNIPALQAADLLAYETGKEIKNRRMAEQRKVSEALKELVAGRPHFGKYLNLDAVESIAATGRSIDGHEDVRLGTVYDANGVEFNRGRRDEIPDE